MKQFFKITLATILGVFISSIIFVLIFFGVIGAIASSSQKQVEIRPNTVYRLDLQGRLVERSQKDPLSAVFSGISGRPEVREIGLDDILSNIKKAKDDNNIKGIYLKGGMLQGGFASMQEIRNALLDFKKSGKFIIAYADGYMQKDYFLASVADKVYINPMGMLEFKGLSAESMFFKNTLDKLGIQMQIVRVGSFKAAVEPFIKTKMSDANKKQVTVYLNSIWNTTLKQVAASRSIPVDSLNADADKMMLFRSAEEYKKCHLVDSLVYNDQMDSIIKTYIGKYHIIKTQDLCNYSPISKYERNKVAIIYAVGDIDMSSDDGIISAKLVKTINKVAKDKNIKAVVLRVNSPGGSAYGAEQIWRALSNLKAKKPLVVSMGDYAASGGYYISCEADSIIAEPNTITGSIGIFGMIPNIQGLDKKLGLTFDDVKTNKMSDAITINRPFTPQERDLMQAFVNRGYATFVKRCADGRKKTFDQINAIAQGRVWTGVDALKIGLVDKLGGLGDAVKMAAKLANVTAYEVKGYPAKEDFMQKLMKDMNDGIETRFAKEQLGDKYQLFMQMKNVTKLNGVMARLPFGMEIK